MSEGCRYCRFRGADDAEHVLHAHAVIAAIAGKMEEAYKKIDRLKELFAQQNKNRIILGLSNDNGVLRGQLAVLRRELEHERQELARAHRELEEMKLRAVPEDEEALLHALFDGGGAEGKPDVASGS